MRGIELLGYIVISYSFIYWCLFFFFPQNLRPLVPPDCPAALRALIEQCWALRPDKRPEFWQIVKVLEQFQLALAETGSLDSVKHVTCQDQKKWLFKLIKKLKSSSNLASSSWLKTQLWRILVIIYYCFSFFQLCFCQLSLIQWWCFFFQISLMVSIFKQGTVLQCV